MLLVYVVLLKQGELLLHIHWVLHKLAYARVLERHLLQLLLFYPR